jgi:predicted dehydrogenase
MALDMTPEQKAIGKANFNRTVGKLAEAAEHPLNRRQFMQGLVAAGATVPIAAAAYFGYTNSGFTGRPVKAGLIGAGDEGGVLVGEHNPAYVEFIAYSDIRPSNCARIFNMEPAPSPRRGFKYHYGSKAKDKIKYHLDYRQLLADPAIEMVVIALPLHLHAEVTIAALRAGKHVLCEKLMAWNITQCKEMIKVAKETNRLLAIGHQRHYSMLYAHANEVVNSGVLGDVTHIRALWHRNNARPMLQANGQPVPPERVNGQTIPVYRDSWRKAVTREDRDFLANMNLRQFGFKDITELVRWRLYRRTGGGLMAELGSHQLDACSIFLGKKHPLAVTAIGGKNFYKDDREIEDEVFCVFEFPGADYRPGPLLDARGNQNYRNIVNVTYSSINSNGFEPYGECLMGSKGTLVVESEQNVMLWGGAGRSTAVTVNTPAGGRPVLDASASTDPGAAQAASTGQNSIGQGPPSKGYKEEMEHFAYCIRMRDQGMERDRADLKPRCDGPAAMADAIIALTANRAMREQKRIEFDPEWFDPEKMDKVPDRDMVAERLT